MQFTSPPDRLGLWNEWHRERGASGQDTGHRESREVFLERLKPSRRRRDVLDLGCGEGHDTVAFVQAGHRVHGLDFSPVAIEKAGRALPRRRWRERRRLALRVHDIARPLPFDDARFDGVFSHLALHYFQDAVTRRILAEITRVTRPGGTLVFSVKSTEDHNFGAGDRVDENLYCLKGHLRHFFTVDYVEELLAGWEVEHVQPYEGHYASPRRSAFVRAVAHKPRQPEDPIRPGGRGRPGRLTGSGR